MSAIRAPAKFIMQSSLLLEGIWSNILQNSTFGSLPSNLLALATFLVRTITS
jgi:hypothetical protein